MFPTSLLQIQKFLPCRQHSSFIFYDIFEINNCDARVYFDFINRTTPFDFDEDAHYYRGTPCLNVLKIQSGKDSLINLIKVLALTQAQSNFYGVFDWFGHVHQTNACVLLKSDASGLQPELL